MIPQSPPPPPPPPWQFSNARVLYQPTLVPIQAARSVTPTSINGLTLLSLFGYTLGGIFVVDWTSSPVGPYREVAILSGLVSRGLAIGAWASHIVVTEESAVIGGREGFGLPTVLGSIDFLGDSSQGMEAFGTDDDDGRGVAVTSWNEEVMTWILRWIKHRAEDVAIALKYAAGTAVPGVAEPAEILNRSKQPYSNDSSSLSSSHEGFVWEGDDVVQVHGWNGWSSSLSTNKHDISNDKDRSINATSKNTGGITLPSFSGCLVESSSSLSSSSDNNNSSATTPSSQIKTTKTTPLLRYPLRLLSAKSIRLRRPFSTMFLGTKPSDELWAVLDGKPAFFPCLQVDGVDVVAGVPEEIV